MARRRANLERLSVIAKKQQIAKINESNFERQKRLEHKRYMSGRIEITKKMSFKQKELLIEKILKYRRIFFENEKLYFNKINSVEITKRLNKLGIEKTATQWIKVWTSIRNELKNKCRKIEQYWLKHDGKYPKYLKLTESEKRIVNLSKEYFWETNIEDNMPMKFKKGSKENFNCVVLLKRL